MIGETSLNFTDIESIQNWLDEKSPASARAINHLSDDEFTEAKSLIALIRSNQATYQLANRYSVEIFDSRNQSGYHRGKHISDELFQEMRFQAFLVMMNPDNDPADYHELHSGICTKLLTDPDGQGKYVVSPVTWIAIIPVFAGLLLLMVQIF